MTLSFLSSLCMDCLLSATWATIHGGVRRAGGIGNWELGGGVIHSKVAGDNNSDIAREHNFVIFLTHPFLSLVRILH
jgi:hypothetical protein